MLTRLSTRRRFGVFAVPFAGLAALAATGGAASALVINVPAQQPTIGAAVAVAVNGDEVVVADGVYTGAGNRNVNLTGKNLVIRSASDNPAACVIDCQTLGRAFLLQSGEPVTTRIRGFTVRGGRAPGGAPPADRGGGIVVVNASCTLENIVFEDCRATTGAGGLTGGGGAVFSFGAGRMIRVDGCVFNANMAGQYGGAMEVWQSTATISACVFFNNVARVGGAIEFGTGTATITNCLFTLNQAGGTAAIFANNGGGGIAAYNSSNVTVRNSTFHDNRANWTGASNGGGGILVSGSTMNIGNSILWGNLALTGGTEQQQIMRVGAGATTLNYSIVEGLTGVFGGAGNISADPAFVMPSGGARDYRLGAGSAAIDAGSNALVPAGVTTDLDGNARFVDAVSYPDTGAGAAPIVDMGAYEAPMNAPGVCPADLDGDGAVSSSDLAILLGSWGAAGGPADLDGSGVVGSGDLAALLGSWGAC